MPLLPVVIALSALAELPGACVVDGVSFEAIPEHAESGRERGGPLQESGEGETPGCRVVRTAADDVPVQQVEAEAGHQRPRNTGVRFSARAWAASRTSSLAHTSRKLCSIAASS